MRVAIHLLSQSQPVVRDDVQNTYTKDGVFCIYRDDETVEKYPLMNIFRVVEPYE